MRSRRRRSASSCPDLAIPKGPTRRALDDAADVEEHAETRGLRMYVVRREGGCCRCCRELFRRLRPIQSMHEIVPRSIVDPATGRLGERSKENSIGVCGSGTTGCHGALQARRITCEKLTPAGAEGPLKFSRS